MIRRTRKYFQNTIDHFGDQPYALLLGVQNEGNDIGFSGAQANARSVRPVTDLLGNELDPQLDGAADIVPIFQCLGNS